MPSVLQAERIVRGLADNDPKSIITFLAHYCGSGTSRTRLIRTLVNPSDRDDPDFVRIKKILGVNLDWLGDLVQISRLDRDAVDAAFVHVLEQTQFKGIVKDISR